MYSKIIIFYYTCTSLIHPFYIWYSFLLLQKMIHCTSLPVFHCEISSGCISRSGTAGMQGVCISNYIKHCQVPSKATMNPYSHPLRRRACFPTFLPYLVLPGSFPTSLRGPLCPHYFNLHRFVVRLSLSRFLAG